MCVIDFTSTHLRCITYRASRAVRGDGGVHREGLGGGGKRGGHRRGAQPSLCRVQERDRREASLVAHHLLDQAEGGEPQQRGPRAHDPGLQIQDQVRALQHLRWNPQAP